jgi:hypothetical protein
MVDDHGPAGGCGTPRFWPDGSLWARPHLISADARRSLTVHFGGIGSPHPIIVASASLKPVVLKLHAGVAQRNARNAAMSFFALTSGRVRCSAE